MKTTKLRKKEVAEVFDVALNTVGLWEKRGYLHPTRGFNGSVWYDRDEVIALYVARFKADAAK